MAVYPEFAPISSHTSPLRTLAASHASKAFSAVPRMPVGYSRHEVTRRLPFSGPERIRQHATLLGRRALTIELTVVFMKAVSGGGSVFMAMGCRGKGRNRRNSA